MAEIKSWDVELEAVTTHHYSGILARTPEEAEDIAEGLLESGDYGSVVSETVDTVIAVPTDESLVSEDYFEEEELEP